jgi:plastocyanin
MRKIFTIFALVSAGAVFVQAKAATHHVLIEGMKFVPQEIEVQKGDTIIWDNKDIVPHTATAKKVFDSGSLAPGKSFRYMVQAKADVSYVCLFHPTMTGKIKVKP